MAEQRYLLALAHQAGPDERIVKGVDGRRDWFTSEEIELAAWRFMQSPRDVGFFHLDDTTGHAQVVESYVYRGPDWQVGETVIKSGDWLIGMVCDESAWQLVKKGRVAGVSVQGRAKVRR